MNFFKNITDDAWVDQAVDIALSGKNAILPAWTQKRHRMLQKRLAYKRQTAPDVLLVGSSRNGFHQPLLSGGMLVNAWINSAMLGDRLFTYRMYERDNLPKALIIGIDPWMFDSNAWRNVQFGVSSLPVFVDEFNGIAKELGFFEAELVNQWGRWQSHNIKKSSLWLEDMRFESPKYYETTKHPLKLSAELPKETSESVHETHRILFPDGSFEHAGSVMNISPDDVWVEASRWGAAYGIYIKHHFADTDNFLWDMFTRFVEHVISKNIKVIFLFVPFHNAAYNAYKLVSGSYSGVDLLEILEEKIINYSHKNNSEVLGSFNPNNCNATYADFVDSWHVKRTLMPRLFGKLLDNMV